MAAGDRERRESDRQRHETKCIALHSAHVTERAARLLVLGKRALHSHVPTMHLQVLGSGSGGNCALIRAGELRLLVDAGLTRVDLEMRLVQAGLPPPTTTRPGLDHVLVTHGHLDHARSAGAIARKYRARLHCAESLMANTSIV